MKTIPVIFFFVFVIQDYTSCNNGLLSKLHQTGYKLKDTRLQLISFNRSIYSNFEIKAFKYNRTTTAHNITFSVTVDAKDKAEVIIQAHKFLSNEYRHFPLRFQVNLKKAIDTNAIGLSSIKNCGNLTDFYLYKNVVYYICNYVIDESRFPPLIPDGKYRVDLTVLYLNEEIALMYLFAEVYTPMTYPKH